MSEHTVLFTAPVDPASANAFIQLLAQLQQQGATRVILALNSGGGHINPGILIYNVLHAMPFELITHNVGNVDSVTNVIFLAGKERYANPAATFMFHGVGFDTSGNQRFEEKRLEAMLDTVLADQKRMSDIIATCTGLSASECMELFKEQKTRDAAWAKSKNIINDVRDFKFPSTGNVHMFVR